MDSLFTGTGTDFGRDRWFIYRRLNWQSSDRVLCDEREDVVDDGRWGNRSKSSEVYTDRFYWRVSSTTTHTWLRQQRQYTDLLRFSWQLSQRDGTSTKHKLTANRRIPRTVVSVSGREQTILSIERVKKQKEGASTGRRKRSRRMESAPLRNCFLPRNTDWRRTLSSWHN